MTRFSIFLPLLCVLGMSSPARAQNFACLDCHDITGAAGANDFSMIYAHTKPHHPVGIAYPSGVSAKDDFNAPNGQSAGVTFFDRNGNGQPDSNEVQLYSVSGAATIECATCHIEHGTTPPPANALPDMYLRVTNAGSVLCSTCHNQ
jgi:hypothetical protein